VELSKQMQQADAPGRGQRRSPHLPARAWRAAGQEAQLTLHLLRDKKPAPDLAPFLGVAAHAAFIDASDLTYIHHALDHPAFGDLSTVTWR